VAVVRQWLEKAAIWLVYGSTIWITVQVLSKPGALTAFFKPGTGGMPLPYALDLVIAMPISWWPLISDYNRFARSDKEGFTGTVVGYTIANTWFYFLGAAIVAFTGITDIVSSISILFLGALALLLILVDETDNAFADIYSSAISLQNLFPRVKQRRFILLVAGVSVALAVSMPLTQYESFLLMIGAFFVPLLGTLFSEFFIVRKRRYRIEEFYSKAEALNPRALTSWLIGVAFYFALARLYPWAGSSLPSFLTSALINYAFSRLKR
jgi:putative hydroxymethylpyrimidine transporter CytX